MLKKQGSYSIFPSGSLLKQVLVFHKLCLVSSCPLTFLFVETSFWLYSGLSLIGTLYLMATRNFFVFLYKVRPLLWMAVMLSCCWWMANTICSSLYIFGINLITFSENFLNGSKWFSESPIVIWESFLNCAQPYRIRGISEYYYVQYMRSFVSSMLVILVPRCAWAYFCSFLQ